MFEYDKIKQFIEEKKHEDQFEEIYKDDANRVHEIVTEITELAEQKKDPQRMKRALLLLKELSVGVIGSLIATGILGLLSKLGV